MNQPSCLSPEVFDTWAEVYDAEPNPLLSLEERVLGSVMPDVRGLDVIDAGCGTGRWLRRLVDCSPRSLVGVDISPQMLQAAAAKVAGNCKLSLGSCTALPVSEAAVDLVLSSFVLSYLHDLEAFAQEIDRVTRPGATVLLADMHPDTEACCNWKRSFQARGTKTEMQGSGWSLFQITRAFQARGFKVLSLLEPGFDVEEKQIFEQRGRLELYQSATTLPAIYVLQLRKPPSSPRLRKVPHETAGAIRLAGARCALGPDAAAPSTLSIVGGTIQSIHSRVDFSAGDSLDLSGYLLLPGLVNSHDHLEFALFPNIGDGPYQNAAQWAQDIHANHESLIAQHRRVPRSTRLWWGAIRNLLCGVTTVCHHNPVTPELMSTEFPVRVVSDMSWAHSLSLEPHLTSKFTESPTNHPFIVHAAEGVDEASAHEVFDLDRANALDQRTVLVHGLACTPEAVSLINGRGAAVILCPTSNQFLFHRSPSLGFIHSINRVILGSDSPLTAAGDLLDEIRFARTRTGLEAGFLYSLVTSRPAEILGLQRGEGLLKQGSIADMFAVRDIGLSPAETLTRLTIGQVELVMLAGRVQLASPSLFKRLPRALKVGLESFEVDGHQRWVRAPFNKLFAEAEEVLGSNLHLGGKRVRCAPAA
jgi:cytosine/adenosine deaminase-related metal-dependent hydrolase/ubiquinone/menaquinone biosynthesis C-methylase UbiE